MPDFRVADTAPEHPKLRAAGLAAFGLWAAAGAYAMRELTDGWVPDYWVQTWPGGRKHATALVNVGLWSRTRRQGLAGYQFHDWTDYQRSAAAVHEERRKGRERAKRSRERSGERNGERSPAAVGNRTALPESSNAVTNVVAPTKSDLQVDCSNTAPPAEMVGRSAEAEPYVRSESHDSRALTRALIGSSVGRGTSSNEREGARNAPPRCPDHARMPRGQRPPPCGPCKELRLNAERDAAAQDEREAAARAERRAAIDACPLCDDQGMRELDDATVTHCAHLEAVS